jgi:tRNA dimethylallyltransferase
MTEPNGRPAALLVAGPTASGKSALALALAERLGGTVINADSMQVYRELRVLTARPSPAEEARVPHALYGVRPAAAAASVAWWRAAALAEMDRARAAGRLPILCGGTGLYFLSLTQGLSEVAAIPDAVRATARAAVDAEGPEAVHARLDAETAAGLRPGDSQRVARAYEVLLATGRGLAAWQREAPSTGPAAWRFRALLLEPPREALRAAIASRFAGMLRDGALDEARGLAGQGLDPALPAMRAHGVPELLAHLRGELGLEDAARRATLHTGQYTKRQATWFRHHSLADARDTHSIHARVTDLAQFPESESGEIFAFVDSWR